MAMSAEPQQSPPRKRARLSLKLVRKDQQTSRVIAPVTEEPGENKDEEPNQQCDTAGDVASSYMEPQSSSIPSEYVIRVAPYTGLHNLGNTCYLNSVLQVLRYCPSFSDNLNRLSGLVSEKLKMKGEEEDIDGEDERSKRRRKEFIAQLKLVRAMNKLFSTMSEKEQSYVERLMPAGQELAMYPEDILEAIRDLNSMFKGYLQHDAQELLCCILSNIQEACQRLGERQGNTENTAYQDNVKTEHSETCRKAVRKLDMGGAGDGVTMETECGKLLGGGRPLGGRTTRSDKTLNEKKLDCKSFNSNGLVTHQENGFGDQPDSNGFGGHDRHVDSIKLCNGNITSTLRKSEKINGVAGGHHGGISPSNDSVRRRGGRKSALTNGHLSEKECNGMDGSLPETNGAGDCGSSKKKRLGLGRLTFQQYTLTKFGIIKKDKVPSTDEQHAQDDASHHHDIKSDSGDDSKEVSLNGTYASRNVTSNNSNDPDLSVDTTQVSLKVDDDVETVERLQGECSQPTTKEAIEKANIDKDKEISTELEDHTIPEPSRAHCALTPMVQDVGDEGGAVDTADAVTFLSEMKVIERLFQGTLVLQTRCLECESCSEKREDFQDVSVPVQSIPAFTSEEEHEERVPDVNPRNLSLGWALSEFTSVERLTDDNKYFCEHCFHLTEAERSVLFGRLPGVLIIQLKRFSAFINCFSPGGSVSKVNDHLAIPLTLNLAKWCSGSCQQKDTSYELSAVVAHSGSSSSSGHYIAYARVPQKNTESQACDADLPALDQCPGKESWAKFDDDRVQVLSDEDFESLLNPLQGNDSAATPYLLLYKDTRQIRR
ncbi:ubiquitin carboxyl-terminal hydrolase 1 [Strongylocentrotus purpuratus]|uniref:Ubiquitin carboxyl-terminal hydrolase n=1 Tax=Strongylocentrotus purpuratus TaxID=7668 RepID=A0A7M7RCM5_STRPU|nr:ubiquitin carboxyl-terminal hydrolase 1 [Strongylocentrotus purpuratus]